MKYYLIYMHLNNFMNYLQLQAHIIAQQYVKM